MYGTVRPKPSTSRNKLKLTERKLDKPTSTKLRAVKIDTKIKGNFVLCDKPKIIIKPVVDRNGPI